VTPELTLFAIKSLIRIGQQTDKALIDIGADRDALFPDGKVFKLQFDQQIALTDFLNLPRFADLPTQAPFKAVWEPEHRRVDGAKWNAASNDKQKIFDAALKAAENDSIAIAVLTVADVKDEVTSEADGERIAGAALIAQWNEKDKPIAPIARVALAIAQVALDYIAIDPSIVGIRGSRGEKILKSFATAITVPLSKTLNADQLGTAAAFHDDLLQSLLGAAFQVFKDRVDEVVSDEHLAKLVKNALEPVVVAAQTGDVTFQRRLQLIFDSLVGPAAAAALKVVSENPAAFFGADFDQSKAAGALVSALLVEAAKGGDVRALFTDQGLVGLLTATVDVAANRPDLFIQSDSANPDKAKLVKDVIASLATAIKGQVAQLPSSKTLDPKRVAGALAAAAIEAVGRNVSVLTANTGQQWHDIATGLVQRVLGGLGTALRDADGQALQKLFSEEQIIELARTVIRDAAATPGLVGADARVQAIVQILGKVVAGDKNLVLTGANVATIASALLAELAGSAARFNGVRPEITVVAQAIAAAMVKDTNRLLAGEDWVEILKVAAAEASANPARLFGLNNNDANQALAESIIGLVLKNVPAIAAGGGGAAILKGDVLREATTILITNLSGRPEVAKKYLPLFDAALKKTMDFVAANPGRYGSKELLQLVQRITDNIVTGKYDAKLAALLAGQQLDLLKSIGEADDLLAGRA
jgi:hypothetical protein